MAHKVEYEFPGSFFPESSSRDIRVRDPRLAVELAPEGAYAFAFYDVADDLPDLGPEYAVSRKPQNRSARYFIDGRLVTIDDVLALPGDHDILISNMRANEFERVVRCRTGNWQPFGDDDELIASRSTVPTA
jgi:hypothetical protein